MSARKPCDGDFTGWRCKRLPHAEGPCALVPKWWNVKGRLTASETVRQLIRDWTNTHKQRGTE